MTDGSIWGYFCLWQSEDLISLRQFSMAIDMSPPVEYLLCWTLWAKFSQSLLEHSISFSFGLFCFVLFCSVLCLIPCVCLISRRNCEQNRMIEVYSSYLRMPKNAHPTFWITLATLWETAKAPVLIRHFGRFFQQLSTMHSPTLLPQYIAAPPTAIHAATSADIRLWQSEVNWIYWFEMKVDHELKVDYMYLRDEFV
jgi:hypothetical protein